MATGLERLRENWFLESTHWGPLLVVRSGAARQRISQKVTSRTSGFGLTFSKHKALAKGLLEQAGMPVAPGKMVHSEAAALQAADALGYPLVTKPVEGDQGIGVITRIGGPEALRKAYTLSSEDGQKVLVEKEIPGRDYRFFVVNGSLLAALERIPAAVEGDGRLTIRQLVESLNAARRREPLVVEGGQKIHLTPIELNQEALELLGLQGMTESSIPKVGEAVRLRYSANFSLGGSVRNCLAEVNPANRKLIETAADLFQLDIAGIDVISTDIRQPIKGSGGVICEINGMPGVLPHMLAEPHRRLLEETALRLLRSTPRRVPLMAIHGAGADALALRLEPELLDHFPGLALATRALWRQAGDLTKQNHLSPFQRHRQVLEDPCADAFLLEIDTRNLLDSGLAWTYTDLLILLEDETEPLDPTWESWLVDNAQTVLALPPRIARLSSLTGAPPVSLSGESAITAELLLSHLPAAPQGALQGPPPEHER
jgi:cyanophycin synthetase